MLTLRPRPHQIRHVHFSRQKLCRPSMSKSLTDMRPLGPLTFELRQLFHALRQKMHVPDSVWPGHGLNPSSPDNFLLIMSHIAQTFELTGDESIWKDTQFDRHFTLHPSRRKAGF